MHSTASNQGFAARRARGIGFLVALALALLGQSARAETISLAELERHALGHRASLAAAVARVAGARERGVAARAPRYPLVTATLSGEMSPGSRLIRVRDLHGAEYLTTGSRALGDDGVLTPDFRHAGLVSVEGRLLDFGRTSASVRASDADAGAASAELYAAKRAVVLDVRSAYLAWLSAFEARRILTRAASESQELRKSAEARVAEGSARAATTATTRLDEARARLELERAGTELARARLAVELAAAVRLPAGAEPDAATLGVHSSTRTDGPDPEALALEQRRAALRAATAASRATAFPVVSANAAVGLRGQAATLFPLYRVGIAITIPIFDGSASTATAGLAVAQAGELLAHATEAHARRVAVRAQASVAEEHAERECALARELLEVAEGIVRRAEEEHALGEDAREPLIRARLERSRAELELLAARIERAHAILSTAPTTAGSGARASKSP